VYAAVSIGIAEGSSVTVLVVSVVAGVGTAVIACVRSVGLVDPPVHQPVFLYEEAAVSVVWLDDADDAGADVALASLLEVVVLALVLDNASIDLKVVSPSPKFEVEGDEYCSISLRFVNTIPFIGG
jgi:hypothetical protein